MVPVTLLTGLVYIIAKNYNFNINTTRNPDMDIRVRRNVKNIELTPLLHDQTSKSINYTETEIPTVLDIFKGQKLKPTPKRDIHNNPNNDPDNASNENNKRNTHNNNGTPNRHNNRNKRDATKLKSHWKIKEDFYNKVYQYAANIFGYGQTTPQPYRYLNNNDFDDGNNNFQNTAHNNDRYSEPYNLSNSPNPDSYHMAPYKDNTGNNMRTDDRIPTPDSAYSNNYVPSNSTHINNGITNYNTTTIYRNNDTFPVRNNDATIQYSYNNNYQAPKNNYESINKNNDTFPGRNNNANVQNKYNNNDQVFKNNNDTIYNTKNSANNDASISNDTNANNEEERVVMSSCFLCIKTNCPAGMKWIGFRCVPQNDDYGEY